jgi:hypothetical protein
MSRSFKPKDLIKLFLFSFMILAGCSYGCSQKSKTQYEDEVIEDEMDLDGVEDYDDSTYEETEAEVLEDESENSDEGFEPPPEPTGTFGDPSLKEDSEYHDEGSNMEDPPVVDETQDYQEEVPSSEDEYYEDEVGDYYEEESEAYPDDM